MNPKLLGVCLMSFNAQRIQLASALVCLLAQKCACILHVLLKTRVQLQEGQQLILFLRTSMIMREATLRTAVLLYSCTARAGGMQHAVHSYHRLRFPLAAKHAPTDGDHCISFLMQVTLVPVRVPIMNC